MAKALLFPIILCLSFPALCLSRNNLKVVKQEMINHSINNYSGSCPCPYNVMRNGRRCGRVSAYSRPGGESPLCFESDISDEQALSFMKRNKN